MALNQLREWLLAPYSENSGENSCKNGSHLSDINYPIHRRMLVISGSDAYCQAALSIITTLADEIASLSVATFTSTELKGKRRKKVLGSEYDIATLDCRDSFKPGDAMAVAGIVKRHGCLILICPEFKQWSSSASVSFLSEGFTITHSRYVARFIECLRTNADIAILSESTARLPDLTTYRVEEPSLERAYRGSLFKSKEQENAYGHLYQSYSLNKLNALVTAPRGRGKSSLLGIFIDSVIRKGKNVLLTSEQRENVANVMSQLHRFDDAEKTVSQFHDTDSENQEQRSAGERRTSLGSVKWVPPDSELLYSADNTTYDLVVIDEAASMPLPAINRIIANNTQWILSTTLQGYEGSGNGFIHKLIPNLPNGSIHLTLSTPLRWFDNDPLEAFFNSTCSFKVNSAGDNLTGVESEDSRELIKRCNFCLSSFENVNESTLQQIMSLLSLAHYQTTPDDFMRLLDSPDVMVATMKLGTFVVAAAIINIEGGVRLSHVSTGIASGRRRPKGHLAAQRLTLLSTDPKAATHNYWRINRIAVHPKLQGRGFGSYVVGKVVDKAREQALDATCTSYGTTLELDNFWTRNGFEIVDYGRKPNKASGETSALALLPLSPKTTELVTNLMSLKASFDAANVHELSKTVVDIYIAKLSHFIQGTRTLEDVWPILHKLAKEAQSDAQFKALSNARDCRNMSRITGDAQEKLDLLIKVIDTKSYLKVLFSYSCSDIKRIEGVLINNGINVNGLKEATSLIRTDLRPALEQFK
ncbi:tRNA(Met) cytidine acetyltransferase [Alteromonas sp. BL110]|uniref:GNAT family N-acetyltransferase n=1 Tax=Alteromonas sp. BL110 TaxID=1714845 RepID=UPI000E46EF93|nr:GNAT family N-acetyltransferase [Alteromonas sp. BL110]AXT37599.1 tRNA(Met) cytidine acetyltransferase [Alteromonas sp. BL110]RKM80337.1 GNAT family N-acetyltransferase [Alteromonas sp. BL110]